MISTLFLIPAFVAGGVVGIIVALVMTAGGRDD